MARTCSTSLVPMPKARAPNAPWVEVWLSPHTMVMPGWVRPCSGPMTWTMPWSGLPIGYSVMPNSAQLARSTSTCLRRDRVGDRLVDVGRRDVVVLGGDGEVGPAHRAAGQAEPVEGLGRGDLVDEVEVDVEQVGLAVGGVDEVVVPDLLAERLPRVPSGQVAGGRARLDWSRACVSVFKTIILPYGIECKRRRASSTRRWSCWARSRRRRGRWPSWSRRPGSRGRRPTGWPWRSRRTGWCAATRTVASRSACGSSRSVGRRPRRSRWPRRRCRRWPRCATRPANRCSSTCATAIVGSASPRSSRRTGCGRSCRWVRRCRSTSGSAGPSCRPVGAESAPNRRRWAESVGEREAGVASVSAGVLDADGRAGGRRQRVGADRAHHPPAGRPLRRRRRRGGPQHRAGRRTRPALTHRLTALP